MLGVKFSFKRHWCVGQTILYRGQHCRIVSKWCGGEDTYDVMNFKGQVARVTLRRP